MTQSIAFEGDGVLREYVGGYSDWLRQRAAAPRRTRDAEGEVAACDDVPEPARRNRRARRS